MITGFSILAVPMGIVTYPLSKFQTNTDFEQKKGGHVLQTCPGCGMNIHDEDAVYCKYCGDKLKKEGIGNFLSPSAKSKIICIAKVIYPVLETAIQRCFHGN